MSETDITAFSERIRKEFPDFKFTHVSWGGQGADHVVLVVDETWIFRFRKDHADTPSFECELAVLSALQENAFIPVPHYSYISKSKDFGGYRMIRGTDLTVSEYLSLADAAKERITAQLAGFLSKLHGLPQSLLARDFLPPVDTRDPDFYAQRYARERRALLAQQLGNGLMHKIDDFYARFMKLEKVRNKVTHADLQADHILLSVDKESVAGIIDFTDAKISDPARDFGFFWGYGEDVVCAIYDKYQFHDDTNFLERSKWHSCRLFVDRLHYDVSHHEIEELDSDKDILEKMLDLVVL